MTVYISIGNSDDKLSQAQWAEFWYDVDLQIRFATYQVHGRWLSLPNEPWQNACWCIEWHSSLRDPDGLKFRAELAQIAAKHNQDSIAWAEATTEFIAPQPGADPQAQP